MIRQTALVFILKIITALASFSCNWILSRLLGAEGLGAYQLALSVTMIGSVVGGLGFNNVVLRLAPANPALKKFGEIKGLFYLSVIFVGLATFLLMFGIHLFRKTFVFQFFPFS